MMKSIKLFLLCLCGTLFMADFSQAKEWHGIVPLHSTRADVERLLGAASNECKCSYYLDDVSVFVVYASGECRSGGSGGWDVQPDTVIRFSVRPKVRPRLSDLKIDEKEFRKTEDPELPGIFYYTNEAEGFIIEVDQGIVTGFYYEPDAKDYHLRCSGSVPKKQSKLSQRAVRFKTK